MAARIEKIIAPVLHEAHERRDRSKRRWKRSPRDRRVSTYRLLSFRRNPSSYTVGKSLGVVADEGYVGGEVVTTRKIGSKIPKMGG